MYIHAQALDTILLETCIRNWYLLYEKVVGNMNFLIIAQISTLD